MGCCSPVPFRLSHFPQAEVRHPSSTVPFGLVAFYTNWQSLSWSLPNVVVSGTCLSLLNRVWGAKLCPYFQVPPPPPTSWIGARWQFKLTSTSQAPPRGSRWLTNVCVLATAKVSQKAPAQEKLATAPLSLCLRSSYSKVTLFSVLIYQRRYLFPYPSLTPNAMS